MTEYVATRWYRAPELLLSWKEYSKAIDMWSIGCILAELIGRKPLLSGKNYLEQLHLLINLVGTPSDEDILNIQSEKARAYLKSLPQREPTDLRKLFPEGSDHALDLLKKLLVFNPNKRLTVEQALDHPFFESIRDKEYEVVANKKFDFDFDKEEYSLEELRQMIFDEMLAFHQDFDEVNPKTFAFPLTKDEDLFTLDLDGSLIYIDYTRATNNIFNLDKSMNNVPAQAAPPNKERKMSEEDFLQMAVRHESTTQNESSHARKRASLIYQSARLTLEKAEIIKHLINLSRFFFRYTNTNARRNYVRSHLDNCHTFMLFPSHHCISLLAFFVDVGYVILLLSLIHI
eukprot:TRINITY_DN952_c0_g1_i24.p1 TRINITY_DN952_c0_g1~~TRINITY_DN952_c0_g1_i24.p1  ORF type:complete len:345 (+),score=47.21 TRINITY_DN952_c0_g1_i24:785-1819(+)